MIATGAGASARKSIGIMVFTGMIASTCLAVLFVLSLFVVVQSFEEWLKARSGRTGGAKRRARAFAPVKNPALVGDVTATSSRPVIPDEP